MRRRLIWALMPALLVIFGLGATVAHAEGLIDDGGAEWRLEQPLPPAPPTGVEGASIPIGLGRIGDIEFFSPNRGALITAGNGNTVPAGVWAYDGTGWHELSTVCGATDGRIAWAGADEFWTISDGRPGQAAESKGNAPPLEDNTLCRFALGASGALEVVNSYASLAFQSTSYLPMHAAACVNPSNCWFGGDALPEPQIGSFQLHWNGRSLVAEPYLPEGHAVEDERVFEGLLYSSVRLGTADRVIKRLLELPALHVLTGEEASSIEPIVGIPLYGANEFPTALDALHLSSDEDALWAAAGPVLEPPEKSAPAGVTVLRLSRTQFSQGAGEYTEEAAPSWNQIVGPETEPTGLASFEGDVVSALGAEPATHSAWIALRSGEEVKSSAGSNPTAPASLARITANGTISDRLELPLSGEPYGPKGAAERLVCPAVHDCWMATTQGWLFHLATDEERANPQPDGDAALSGANLITVRPADEGVPQVPADLPPVDNSGLEEEKIKSGKIEIEEKKQRVRVPLLSKVKSRLVKGTTLELSFHLTVKARVRLVAKRKGSVVASTPKKTLKAGKHSLLLRLDAKRWPTKLDLQTHALAPLPTREVKESSGNAVSTSLVFPRLRETLGSQSFASGLSL